ncbi:MAG: S28 family serine protease [Bdellovibrionota bacterium]
MAAFKFVCLQLSISLFAQGALASAAPTPGLFAQLIDHSQNSSPAKFNQRFWIESHYAQDENSPILLHIGGEYNAEGDLNDFDLEYAKALHSHIVYLEHRYYGMSQPFSDLSAQNLKFLTVDNAIADLAEFQKWISEQKHWRGKWIALGGSYPGTLAALYRLRHPELVVGALASSAPMIAIRGEEVDDQFYIDKATRESSADPTLSYRQWAYQACTDFGAFMMWKPPARPSQRFCRNAFGISKPFDDDAFNKQTYLPFTQGSDKSASNILFTNGSVDSIASISITPRNNRNPRIVTLLIEGAGHHFDLSNLPDYAVTPQVTAARVKFLELAKYWLKTQ